MFPYLLAMQLKDQKSIFYAILFGLLLSPVALQLWSGGLVLFGYLLILWCLMIVALYRLSKRIDRES